MSKRRFYKKQAIDVFRLKIGLEKTFRVDLNKYFAEVRRAIKQRGFVSIQTYLDLHYKRIARRLLHRNIKQNVIDDAVSLYLEGKATERSLQIDDTTRKDINESMEEARKQLYSQDVLNPTEKELMLLASMIFFGKSRARIGLIANTETQTITEGLRSEVVSAGYNELLRAIDQRDNALAMEIYELTGSYVAYEVADQIGLVETGVLTMLVLSASKRWVTMGDSKVRAIHISANGQEVPVYEPFTVNGELLMFPGDSSLGASAKNTIRCRCVAVY